MRFKLSTILILLVLTKFVINIFEDESNKFNNTDDQAAERNRSQMKSKDATCTLCYRKCGKICLTIECPIPACERTSQYHISKILNEA